VQPTIDHVDRKTTARATEIFDIERFTPGCFCTRRTGERT